MCVICPNGMFLVVSLVWCLEKAAIIFSCFELTAIGGGDVMCLLQR
jgi:hypothetical protein